MDLIEPDFTTIAKFSEGWATPVAIWTGFPAPFARRSEAVFITAETSTEPAAIAWLCWAPDVIVFQFTFTPSFANAFSRSF